MGCCTGNLPVAGVRDDGVEFDRVGIQGRVDTTKKERGSHRRELDGEEAVVNYILSNECIKPRQLK